MGVYASAAFGAPVAERMRVAQECVVVCGKAQPSTAREELLRDLMRVDRKMLRARLSHLAEGHYDLNGDVVRNHLNSEGAVDWMRADTMAVDDDDRSCSYTAVFRRRDGAQQAKSHTRRAAADME